MVNCKYKLTLDGNVFYFNSERELIDHVKDARIGKKDQIKFSLELSERQEKVVSTINNTTSSSSYNKDIYSSSFDFLKKLHPINGTLQLLAPEFDQNNYIENQIKKLSEKAGREFTSEEIKQHKENLEVELNEDNIMRSLGISIHDLVLSAVEINDVFDSELIKKMYDFVDKVEEYNFSKDAEFSGYPTEVKRDMVNNIRNQLGDFVRFVNGLGHPIIKPKLLNTEAQVKDMPDLIVVDGSGDPHIIDISLSRKRYSD